MEKISEVSPNALPRKAVFHHACRAMGTRFSLVLTDVDALTAETLAEWTENHLRLQERLMSRFDVLSPISELNNRAADEPVTVQPALWEILTLCREHWQRTRGAFDITQWPLNALWREHVPRGESPSPGAIGETLKRAGMHRMHFDEAARTIKFEAAEMSVDLGGFGKGFALEGVVNHFRQHGIERAFFSFGESSVAVIGSHPHGPAWPVGIANMFHPELAAHTFSLCDNSLSTSGTAPFNETGGPQNLGHIINPRDGQPIAGYRTMSVVAASAADAEVLSTALLVTPETGRGEILGNYSAASAIEIVYEPHNHFAPRIQWQYET